MDNPKVLQCYCCNKVIGKFEIKTFAMAYKNYTVDNKRKCFCSEKCYNDYKKRFIVDYINENPIYKVDIDKYAPYLGCPYYFDNIEDCRKRMQIKNIGIYQIY